MHIIQLIQEENKEANKLITIGDTISEMIELRKKQNIRQTEIAQRMKVKKNFISRIERGDVDIRISTLIKYLDAMGLSIIFTKKQ